MPPKTLDLLNERVKQATSHTLVKANDQSSYTNFIIIIILIYLSKSFDPLPVEQQIKLVSPNRE